MDFLSSFAGPPCFAAFGSPSGADVQGEPTSPGSLLMGASHVVVPVHERALRVIPPRPDVKLVQRIRNGVPVRAVDEQEDLTL